MTSVKLHVHVHSVLEHAYVYMYSQPFKYLKVSTCTCTHLYVHVPELSSLSSEGCEGSCFTPPPTALGNLGTGLLTKYLPHVIADETLCV